MGIRLPVELASDLWRDFAAGRRASVPRLRRHGSASVPPWIGRRVVQTWVRSIARPQGTRLRNQGRIETLIGGWRLERALTKPCYLPGMISVSPFCLPRLWARSACLQFDRAAPKCKNVLRAELAGKLPSSVVARDWQVRVEPWLIARLENEWPLVEDELLPALARTGWVKDTTLRYHLRRLADGWTKLLPDLSGTLNVRVLAVRHVRPGLTFGSGRQRPKRGDAPPCLTPERTPCAAGKAGIRTPSRSPCASRPFFAGREVEMARALGWVEGWCRDTRKPGLLLLTGPRRSPTARSQRSSPHRKHWPRCTSYAVADLTRFACSCTICSVAPSRGPCRRRAPKRGQARAGPARLPAPAKHGALSRPGRAVFREVGAMDSDHARPFADRLADELLAKRAITGETVERAFRRVRRHLFIDEARILALPGHEFRVVTCGRDCCDEDALDLAYRDEAAAIGPSSRSSCSAPYCMAWMMQEVGLEAGMRVSKSAPAADTMRHSCRKSSGTPGLSTVWRPTTRSPKVRGAIWLPRDMRQSRSSPAMALTATYRALCMMP